MSREVVLHGEVVPYRRAVIRSLVREMRVRPQLALRMFPVLSVCSCGAVIDGCLSTVAHAVTCTRGGVSVAGSDEISAAKEEVMTGLTVA